MTKRRTCLRWLATVPIVHGLGACATDVPAIRWYSLIPTDEPAAAATPVAAAPLTLAVGPVTVPDEVDRPQLIVHTPTGDVMLLDNERWTASLKAQVARAVALHVGRRVPQALVAAYPNTALANPQWQLLIDVQRFELRQGTPGSASLRALWTLRSNVAGVASRPAQVTDVSIAADAGRGLDGLAAAMRDALARLAADVAARL